MRAVLRMTRGDCKKIEDITDFGNRFVLYFSFNDVFRFAQNDVSLCDMMYLLRKYDVAPLRVAMMKYPPFAAGKHH